MLVAASLLACAPNLREIGARDLDCTAEDVSITYMANHEYMAKGCGKRQLYVGVGNR